VDRGCNSTDYGEASMLEYAYRPAIVVVRLMGEMAFELMYALLKRTEICLALGLCK